MHRKVVYPLAIAVVIIPSALFLWVSYQPLKVNDIVVAYERHPDCTPIKVVYPQDKTVFPPEIVPPTFRWEDVNPAVSAWLVRVELAGGPSPVNCLTRQPQWVPTPQEWEIIKKASTEKETRVLLIGVKPGRPVTIRSAAALIMQTSKDEVGAPLLYREVNLPFIDAVTDPSKIRWRFGSISSPQPPIVLTNLPVCGNCHSFPRDARTLAMDVDYANSKGSYVITAVMPEMVLATSDIITWNDYRKEDGEQTFGLLSQISPDGRYVVSTVKDKSVFVPMPDLAFSQLFFPIKGILCVYDKQTGTFSALPGADDPQYVQSNPSWSPDGKHIVFARAKAYDLKDTKGQGKVLLTREECKEFVEDGKPFLFDLYRLPFNGGKGGVPEPVKGASNNGMSNFFARYSPDGRWIVFCQARSYMLLQKDSELHIIPAAGGEPRRLRGNTGRMNSWHSWSPNGKWLVFASKGWSDYTQLCLTHIDEKGESSPPVLLSHLTSPDRAANIPEFVNARPDAIVKIGEQFLNDYSFVRAGNEFYRHGDADHAITEYYNALKLNPANIEAHQKLGFLLYHVKDAPEKGMAHLLKTLELDPHNPRAHYDLGMAQLHQHKIDEAATHLQEALRQMPEGLDEQYTPVRLHFHFGEALLLAGRSEEARVHLSRVVQLSPTHPEAHYRLAHALANLGQMDQALVCYAKGVKLDPRVDTSPTLHHALAAGYLQKRQFREALGHEQRALALAQAQGDKEMAAVLRRSVDDCRKLTEATNK